MLLGGRGTGGRGTGGRGTGGRGTVASDVLPPTLQGLHYYLRLCDKAVRLGGSPQGQAGGQRATVQQQREAAKGWDTADPSYQEASSVVKVRGHMVLMVRSHVLHVAVAWLLYPPSLDTHTHRVCVQDSLLYVEAYNVTDEEVHGPIAREPFYVLGL